MKDKSKASDTSRMEDLIQGWQAVTLSMLLLRLLSVITMFFQNLGTHKSHRRFLASDLVGPASLLVILERQMMSELKLTLSDPVNNSISAFTIFFSHNSDTGLHRSR